MKLIATGTRVGSLYYLDCLTGCQNVNVTGSDHVESKEEVWHRRFGHLGVRNLQKLAKDELVSGYDYDVSKDIGFCELCTEGKHHRSQFPANTGKRSKELLGLVHGDICGKINAKSLSIAEYFLTFIDDCTCYVWVYILKRKDQAFLEWKALVEKSTGQKLKMLRTDNGEGIRHQLTVPKTPEQNGVAERMNRTLIEKARAILADAKLPQKFWAEALSTAVYLCNRSPTKAVEGMTPFESWMGEKPAVDHLRVFGCSAYAHVPKDERQKVGSKSQKCVLLGYGSGKKDTACTTQVVSKSSIVKMLCSMSLMLVLRRKTSRKRNRVWNWII